MWLLLAWFVFYALLSPGFPSSETPTYELILNILEHGRISSTDQLSPMFFKSPDGLFYDAHDIGSSLLALPIAWIVHSGLSILGVQPTVRHLAFAGGFLGALYTSVALVFFFLTLTRLYNCLPQTALLSTILLGTGTQLLVYSGGGSDITVSTMLLSLLFFYLKSFWLFQGLRYLIVVFFLLSVLIVTRITAAVLIPILFSFLLLDRGLSMGIRLRGLLVGFLILFPAILWTLYYNEVRMGHPFVYPVSTTIQSQFNPDYYRESLPGVLFSPSKGLLAFNLILLLVPLAIAHYWRFLCREVVLVASLFLMTLARSGAMLNWAGGGGWGARYYTYMIPLFFLPVAILIDRDSQRKPLITVVFLLWMAGFLVNLSGVITNWHYRQSLMGARSSYSVWSLYGQPLDAVVGALRNVGRMVGADFPIESVPNASSANVSASNSISVWWLNMRLFGVPLGICLLAGGVQSILAAIFFIFAYRRLSFSQGSTMMKSIRPEP